MIHIPFEDRQNPEKYKSYLYINADTLEVVTIKDMPTQYLTGMMSDTGFNRKFDEPLGRRKIKGFEINHDEKNTVLLYLDTLEKVSLKDESDQILTDYRTHQGKDSHSYNFLWRA